MHNLRRLAAGMRGEYMEPEVTPEPEDTSTHTTLNGSRSAGGGGILKHSSREEDIEGWMDKEDYEREEGVIEIGEIGQRSTFVREGGGETEVKITGGPEFEGGRKRKTSGLGEEHGDGAGAGAGEEHGAGGEGRVVDKEARKKAKKEKRKQEQKEKEKNRAKEKAIEDKRVKKA
jgi:hypothetical protein